MDTDVIVIGAGLAGLQCARRTQAAAEVSLFSSPRRLSAAG